jgi:hypothetical protein
MRRHLFTSHCTSRYILLQARLYHFKGHIPEEESTSAKPVVNPLEHPLQRIRQRILRFMLITSLSNGLHGRQLVSLKPDPQNFQTL